MRHRLVAALTSLLLALGTLVGLTALSIATAPASYAGTTVIPVPTSAAGLGRIVASPDGNVWFVERDANKVGRISPGGQITEFAFPADSPGITKLEDLDVAPDGSVWVVYESGERIRHIDANGNAISDRAIGQYPYGEQVRVATDGTAVVTMSYDEQFVTLVNDTAYVDLPNSPECEDALGRAADGNMWCRTSSGLTRLNPSGGGVTYPANNYAAYPYAIAAGPVGSIWFGRYFSGTFATSPDDGEVGYLDAATGAITAFNTGSRTAPNSLIQGPDGNMWFTSIGAAKGIGHIAPNGSSGALTAIGSYAPNSIAFGTDGAVYATDGANNVIIKTTIADLQVTNVDPGEGSVLTGGGTGGAIAKVKTGKKPIVVKKSAVPLRVACPKDATNGCVGKVRLTTNAKKKAKAVSAKAGYKLKAGKKKSVRVRLNGKGLKALKKGRVKLRLELYVKGVKQPVSVSVVKVRR